MLASRLVGVAESRARKTLRQSFKETTRQVERLLPLWPHSTFSSRRSTIETVTLPPIQACCSLFVTKAMNGREDNVNSKSTALLRRGLTSPPSWRKPTMHRSGPGTLSVQMLAVRASREVGSRTESWLSGSACEWVIQSRLTRNWYSLSRYSKSALENYSTGVT